MSKKELEVFSGILDGAASEFLVTNLQSTASVQQYAINGCDISVSDKAAKKIRETAIVLLWDRKNSVNAGCSQLFYDAKEEIEKINY
jgi:hypothetical protein